MTGAASDIVASRRRRRGSDFDVAAVLVVVVVPNSTLSLEDVMLLLLFITLTKCNKASTVRRCVTIATGIQVTFTRVGLSPRSGSGGESSHSTFKIFFFPSSCVAHL